MSCNELTSSFDFLRSTVAPRFAHSSSPNNSSRLNMPRKGSKRRKTRTHVRPFPPSLPLSSSSHSLNLSLPSSALADLSLRCILLLLAGQTRSQRPCSWHLCVRRSLGRSKQDSKVVCRKERNRRRECRSADKGCQEGARAKHGVEAQGASPFPSSNCPRFPNPGKAVVWACRKLKRSKSVRDRRGSLQKGGESAARYYFLTLPLFPRLAGTQSQQAS